MRAFLILALMIGFMGCDSDDDDDTTPAQDATAPVTDNGVTQDTGLLQDSGIAPEDMTVAPQPDAAVELVCQGGCFSNHDCPEGTRCVDHDADEMTLPCCFPGERGTLAVGEPCDPATGQETCASSICIEGEAGTRCSDTCQSVDDCPASMALCQFIAFSDSDAMWCFPQ
ncbi:hypothetical protein KKF91_08620 [Myxococcota bacterium]|nr:hypothetical protein [Myxococcota bacterium]MBU1430603.1 hypothetical protein [Myxococcota bacterium]MBU1898708.1 hypothetical protein [Myxococcota bacterium]